MSDFGNVVTAMITPFTASGEVDYATTERLADYLVTHGTDTVLVCGTTGESPTLTWAEEYELFRVVQQAVGSRGKIMAGTGSNSTREAIDATKKAAKLGLDGTLQVVPYYNKPPQAGLYLHFEAIAKACPDLPMMLYNVPGRTGQSIDPHTVARLAQLDSIVAIKEASGSVDSASQIRTLTPPDFAIYSGDDSLTLPLLAIGGCGVVSVASHLVGADLQRMVNAFKAGHIEIAQQIHLRLFELFKVLFCTANPIPVKAALAFQGWSVGSVRLPLCAISPDQSVQVKTVLENLDLLTHTAES